MQPKKSYRQSSLFPKETSKPVVDMVLSEDEEGRCFCTHEDRAKDYVAQKLLVESLQRWSPHEKIYIPADGISPDHLIWLRQQPNVRVIEDFKCEQSGWDVKPTLLLYLIEKGKKRVSWIDSDIIVFRDPHAILDDLPEDSLVVAEEGYRTKYIGTALRAKELGLCVGKEYNLDVCSAFVSVSSGHQGILRDWSALLKREDYVYNQSLIIPKRQFHLAGDQEILGGLIGSKAYEGLNVSFFRSSVDIIHCQAPHFYTLRQRLKSLFAGQPALIHAQAKKPWRPEFKTAESPLDRHVSIYTSLATDYCNEEWVSRANNRSLFHKKIQEYFPNKPSIWHLDEGMFGSLRILGSKILKISRRNSLSI
jgi:hypothetical protein